MAYASWSVVFGEQPSAAKWNILGTNDAYFDSIIGSGTAYSSWTPTLTNWTVGNGTLTGRYTQFGKTVIGRLSFVFGSTSAVSGDMIFSFPVTAISHAGTAAVPQIGGANLFDASVPRVFQGVVNYASTTTANVRPQFADTVALYSLVASSTAPFTWTTSDEVGLYFTYQAA